MGTSHIFESRCIFKLKRVWRVCLQTGDWVKLWNASDMSCVLYVLFSVFTEEEILIFKLFQMSAGSAENNLQSHQELRVTGKPPGSWKTRKLFHLRAESCGRGCSWGVEGSSGRWMLGVFPSVWSALSQAPNPRTPVSQWLTPTSVRAWSSLGWWNVSIPDGTGWALTPLATQTIPWAPSFPCSFQIWHLLMLDPRLWITPQHPGSLLNFPEIAGRMGSCLWKCHWLFAELLPAGASLGKHLEVCSLCKMLLLLCPIGVTRLGIAVSISPLLGKILSSYWQPEESLGLVTSSIFPKPQQNLT